MFTFAFTFIFTAFIMEEDRAETDIGLAAEIEEQHREEDLEKALAEQAAAETTAEPKESKETDETPALASPPAQPQETEAPSGETDFTKNAAAQATDTATGENPDKPTLKQPKKRFIGRRAAAEVAKNSGLSVEDSGAVGE